MNRHRRNPGSIAIDARLAGASAACVDQEVLRSQIRLARSLAGAEGVIVHVNSALRSAYETVAAAEGGPIEIVETEPDESRFMLKADRLYNAHRLQRTYKQSGDPERAVLWRIDSPERRDSAVLEIERRRSAQPLGKYWALSPARFLAKTLANSVIKPNYITILSGCCVLYASYLVGFASGAVARATSAGLLALGLVLDTADGHLARLQGSASEFGRWLDANLDELGDMALHAAAAWSFYIASGMSGWLVLGMAYAMAKYLFFHANVSFTALGKSPTTPAANRDPQFRSTDLRGIFALVGHADVRWHIWIVLAAAGRLDVELVVYTTYFFVRALAGSLRKGGMA